MGCPVFTAWPLGCPQGLLHPAAEWAGRLCLQLPKPHCLAGRAGWYQPFCCPHAHIYQVVLRSCLMFHTLGTPSEPSSRVHLTACTLRRCNIWPPQPAASPRAPRNIPVPAPSSPIPHHAHTRPPAAPLAFTLISQGWHAVTNTSAEDRAGQEGHRQRKEANTVTICQEMAWEHNPDSACPVAGTVRPQVSTLLSRESPKNQCEWSGNFTLSMAVPALCQACLFPRFAHPRRKQHILPGETVAPVSTVQPGGASVLEIHVWRNKQPNSTNMSAFNYSRSGVQIFPFLSCVLLPKT